MDEVDKIIGELRLTAPWMDLLRDDCPFCGEPVTKAPGSTSPDVGRLACDSCGFTATVTAPYDMWDKRWAHDVIVLEED